MANLFKFQLKRSHEVHELFIHSQDINMKSFSSIFTAFRKVPPSPGTDAWSASRDTPNSQYQIHLRWMILIKKIQDLLPCKSPFLPQLHVSVKIVTKNKNELFSANTPNTQAKNFHTYSHPKGVSRGLKLYHPGYVYLMRKRCWYPQTLLLD